MCCLFTHAQNTQDTIRVIRYTDLPLLMSEQLDTAYTFAIVDPSTNRPGARTTIGQIASIAGGNSIDSVQFDALTDTLSLFTKGGVFKTSISSDLNPVAKTFNMTQVDTVFIDGSESTFLYYFLDNIENEEYLDLINEAETKEGTILFLELENFDSGDSIRLLNSNFKSSAGSTFDYFNSTRPRILQFIYSKKRSGFILVTPDEANYRIGAFSGPAAPEKSVFLNLRANNFAVFTVTNQSFSNDTILVNFNNNNGSTSFWQQFSSYRVLLSCNRSDGNDCIWEFLPNQVVDQNNTPITSFRAKRFEAIHLMLRGGLFANRLKITESYSTIDRVISSDPPSSPPLFSDQIYIDSSTTEENFNVYLAVDKEGDGFQTDDWILISQSPLTGSGAPAVPPRFNGDRYFDVANNRWYMGFDNENGNGTGDGLDIQDWVQLN